MLRTDGHRLRAMDGDSPLAAGVKIMARAPQTRALGEFGDDPGRYANARARKNYAATSPITRQPGRKKTVAARFVHNDRLVDALARRPKERSRSHQGPGSTTTSSGLDGSGTLRRCVNSPTGWLASCTAA